MILSLIIHNPVTDCLETWNIQYPNVTKIEWITLYCFITEDEIIRELDNILNNALNVTLLYKDKQVRSTTTYNYKNSCSWYWHHLLRINNPFLYNKYLDKLINKHIENLLFEKELRDKQKDTIVNIKPKRKRKKNEYKQYVSRDMFDNSINYIYINNVTGEQIISKDNSLLNELNTKKKAKKKQEDKFKHMTFKFK